MPKPPLTPAECELVRLLLRLYEAATENRHSRFCECPLCEMIGTCGEVDIDTFASLEKKATAATNLLLATP